MMNLKTRLAKLEEAARPARVICMYWPLDDVYTVGPEAFTLEEFKARFGGDPEEVCIGRVFAIGGIHWDAI